MPTSSVIELKDRGLTQWSQPAAKRVRRVLMLQGPVGPFFKLLQRRLEESDIQTCRVTFNAADRHYAGHENTIRFAGGPADFSRWLEKFTEGQPVGLVILFGAMRPLHVVAREFFRVAGVPVLCLEEGYLRPGYITAEINGNNASSPIAGQLPETDGPNIYVPLAASMRSSFRQMASYAFIYYTIQGLLSGYRERKGFHKKSRANVVREGAYWLRNYYRRMRHAFPNMRLVERLLEVYDKKYFLVPFQVADDAQLTTSASKNWNNELMALKTIESFSRHAPEDHRLVFKIHPLERGHSDARRLVAEIADQFDVADRVDVLDIGSIGLLTRHSAGMITINSTSGLSALSHGVPLAILGKAIYANPKLCSVIEDTADLNRFWTSGIVATRELRLAYLDFLRAKTMLPGDYYLREEQQVAVHRLLEKVERLLATPVSGQFTAGESLGQIVKLSRGNV